MNRRIALEPRTALLVVVLGGLLAGCSQQAPTGTAAQPTGKALFVQHCASCHGENADGKGPLAESLKKSPSDLRKLARKNGGRFDERYVMHVIDGRNAVEAHGPRDMPVWGAVFEEAHRPAGYPAYTSLLHSRALTDYLHSIQQD